MAFKIGDRVQAISPSWGDEIVPVGSVGTVLDIAGSNHPYVRFDGIAGDRHTLDSGWQMFGKQLRHVRRFAIRKRAGADKPWRVLVESDGNASMLGAFHSFTAAQAYLRKFRLQMGRL